MSNVERAAVFLTVAMASGGCAVASAPSEEETLVRSYIEAYNSHDIPVMLELATEGVEWFGVEGARLDVMTSGKQMLADELTSYFEGLPSARSEIESISALGAFVTTHERAYWTQEGQERSQASLAVYEVRDGAIMRVWYYPAVP